jgi:uncharacterized protein YceK
MFPWVKNKENTMRTISLALVGISLLSGCSAIRSVTMPPEDNLLSGAGALLVSNEKAEKFEQIDLDKLLTDYGFGDRKVTQAGLKDNAEEFRYRRNDMQDRILAASNQRCGTYLRELVASKSQTKMGWGSAALLLSGAASVVTHAHTAKALAAGSTAATGINSLYNEAYFNNLALNVISAGISKQREQILGQITTQRAKPMADYPVNRAVADALQYHAACNMISGLEAAAVATKAIANEKPGSDPQKPQPSVAPAIY